MPTAARSSPQRSASAASRASDRSACSSADGISAKPGPRSRCTCPPSWSTASRVRIPSGRRVLWRTSVTTRRVACAPAVELPSRITLPVRLSARMSRSLEPSPVESTATIRSWPTWSAGERRSTRSAQTTWSGVGVSLGVGGAETAGVAGPDAVVGAVDGVGGGVVRVSGIGT